jgi:phosphoadenosine phosphosulfate reductase
MPLYRNGRFEIDSWQRVEAPEDLPAQGQVLLSLAQWQQVAAPKCDSNVAFGVLLEPGEQAEAIADDLSRLALVAVNFPKFTDGRGCSTVRILRDRYKFAGELRAIGDILFDQLQFYQRCGFDTLEIKDPTTLKLLEAGQTPIMTHFYQPGEGPELKDSNSPWRRRAGSATAD